MSNKNRVIYLGAKIDRSKEVYHAYMEVSEDNILIGEVLKYGKKLFKKGRVGSIYDCTIKDNTINYSKNETPVNLIEIGESNFKSTYLYFPEIKIHSDVNSTTLAYVKASKEQKTDVSNEIDKLKLLYKLLKPSQREVFLTRLVYKITS